MTDQPRRRVILAEDDPASRRLLVWQLERAGFDVIGCADGQEALEAIRAEGAGIIVADWSMPKMDGLELCQAVRQQCDLQALGMVYFILLTAHTEKENIVAGLAAGADDYLTKPYHHQELLARIRAGERIIRLHEETVHSQMALHKANAQLAILNGKLDKLAHTDALTELPNRRYTFQRLEQVWALAERNDHQLTCIMLDIDHFKRVNDTYGHEAGDEVLKYVAAAIGRNVRVSEICGRFGGEEFLVVCPETDGDGGVVVAERLRGAIAGTDVPVGDAVLNVTISVGLAAKRPTHTRPDMLVAEADSMLYLAKDNGRNQVWRADHDGVGYPISPTPNEAHSTT
ncbi:MAG: diguanylate cyclase [Planctomycetes bacterium]|nr:diguanylate cyclase [Planctomycetota bacterium]